MHDTLSFSLLQIVISYFDHCFDVYVYECVFMVCKYYRGGGGVENINTVRRGQIIIHIIQCTVTPQTIASKTTTPI